MALTYTLTDKQLTDQGQDVYQASYTCTVYDERSEVVLTGTVSGAVNKYSATWADGVATQIAGEINVLLERAEQHTEIAAKTDGLADKITALVGGE